MRRHGGKGRRVTRGKGFGKSAAIAAALAALGLGAYGGYKGYKGYQRVKAFTNLSQADQERELQKRLANSRIKK